MFAKIKLIFFPVLLLIFFLYIGNIIAKNTENAPIKLQSGKIDLSVQGNISAGLSFKQGKLDINVAKPKIKTIDPVSISNLNGGKITGSKVKTQPINMLHVSNLGKPVGVISKAQSIKSSLKHVDSEELNLKEEKRRKRKANFNKKLKKKAAGKALLN